MPELESKLQSKIIKFLKKNGWLVRKILSTNCPGDPDIYSYKLGITMWIETKRLGKTSKPLQVFRQQEIKSAGMICFEADNFEQFINLYNTTTQCK